MIFKLLARLVGLPVPRALRPRRPEAHRRFFDEHLNSPDRTAVGNGID